MNYIKHLTGFFDRAAKDQNLNSTHISLYMAIFQLWNLNRFKNPISLSRSELMGLSKVSSNTTYHKCMKELQKYGYLRYDPSFHPLRGSWVFLFPFDEVFDKNQSILCARDGQVVDKHESAAGLPEDKLGSETQEGSGVPRPINICKHNKHTKLSFLKKEVRDKIDKNGTTVEENSVSIESGMTTGKDFKAFLPQPKAVSSQKGQPPVSKPRFELIPQKVETVIDFFLASAYPESQAIKFFHYYSATGWKLGGKSQIENWHAAAHSWMLNAKKRGDNGKSPTGEPRAGKLHTKSDKNYSEPL